MRAALEIVIWGFVVVSSGLAGSVLVYALGSFALMRRHTAGRAFGTSLRELAREVFLVGVTQPLVPLFYMLGHRMDPLLARLANGSEGVASGVPVVFVHGYMQNRVDFLGLARALARRRIGPLFGFNYPWFGSLESNAKRLERFVERVCRETGSAVVDVVCHSMGGLVAIEMLRDEVGKAPLKVRRCVTIATPHAGVAWRGPMLGVGATRLRRGSKLLEAHARYALTLPVLSVFSSHDNIVHPKETSHLAKRGGRDVEVEGFAHLSLLFAPAVAEHVASFLLEPAPAPELASPEGVAVAVSGEGVAVAVAAEGVAVAVSGEGVAVASSAEGVAVASSAEGVVVASSAEGVVVASSAEGVAVAVSGEGVAVASSVEGVGVASAAEGVAVAASAKAPADELRARAPTSCSGGVEACGEPDELASRPARKRA